MRIRKVSAVLLEPANKPRASRDQSPREQRRIELERKLELAVRRADRDASAAFRLDLEDGEKPAAERLAFRRVGDRTGVDGVNLFARDGLLVVAKRPQRGAGGHGQGRPEADGRAAAKEEDGALAERRWDIQTPPK